MGVLGVCVWGRAWPLPPCPPLLPEDVGTLISRLSAARPGGGHVPRAQKAVGSEQALFLIGVDVLGKAV